MTYKYEARKIGKVKGLGDIYQVTAPLDEQLRAFADKGIHTLAAPDEVAQIHLAGVSKDYSRTNMAPIALKSEKTILVRDVILMNHLMASTVVRHHKNRGYFETCRKVYEAAEALARSQESMYPEDRSALIVSQREGFVLTPEMPESQFILRKQTEPYFDRFDNGTMKFSNLYRYLDRKVIINYMWFGPSISNYCLLDCIWLGLDKDDVVYGVLRNC